MWAGEEVNLLHLSEQHLQHFLYLLHLGEGTGDFNASIWVGLL